MDKRIKQTNKAIQEAIKFLINENPEYTIKEIKTPTLSVDLLNGGNLNQIDIEFLVLPEFDEINTFYKGVIRVIITTKENGSSLYKFIYQSKFEPNNVRRW
jgi:hypothetical protein